MGVISRATSLFALTNGTMHLSADTLVQIEYLKGDRSLPRQLNYPRRCRMSLCSKDTCPNLDDCYANYIELNSNFEKTFNTRNNWEMQRQDIII